MGKATAKQQVSEYSMAIHLGLCHGPIDAITGLYVGEKLAWSGVVTASGNVAVSAPNLFGGPKEQGGVGGVMVYLDGNRDQIMPAALAARLGLTSNTCPAYRNVASVFFIGYDNVPAGSINVSGAATGGDQSTGGDGVGAGSGGGYYQHVGTGPRPAIP